MGKKIIVAGNIVVDRLYPIAGYPEKGQLTTILNDGMGKSVGGLVCNVGIDLKKLLPDYEIKALGLVGDDENGEYAVQAMKDASLDVSLIGREGLTSFTAVMNDTVTGERTFFHYRGANALLSEDSFDWDDIDCDLIHAGYILLLDSFDEPDDEYGTKFARFLAHAQKKGIKTSIDVVSENSDRFNRLVPPALRYTDYCVINEIEASRTTGIPLREKDGTLIYANIRKVLSRMFELGVGEWAIIHCPEGGFGMDRSGNFSKYGQIKNPPGFVKGKVGAGDAFCAGVLAAAMMGRDLGFALKLGNAAATASLASPGATEAMMTAEECLELADGFGAKELPEM